MSQYKIMMTGGGSAGHVTPNLALIPRLKSLGYEVKYIGSNDGIEKEIVEREGIPYYGISSGKLRRYFDVKNFTDPFKVIKGLGDAYKVLKKEKPNLVFSKGGFVTVPVVFAAYLNKIPVVCHESDITPGLANKLSTPFATKLCVTFPESLSVIKGNKGVLTGTPIREELFLGNRDKGLHICKLNKDKPVIFIMGGSLGSKFINDTVRDSLDDLLENFNVVHICGKGHIEDKLKNKKGYVQFEYITNDLTHVINAADIVVSRAGANSIYEFLALKKPNLLIPLSRKSSRGDQILNARSFEKSGYSMVIEEENLNKDIFKRKVNELYKDRKKYIDNMEKSPIKNGLDRIIEVISNSTKK